MSFYGGLAATADRLLKKFGAGAVLTIRTTGVYDPNVGEAPVTVQNINVTACVFDIAHKEIDGTNIKANDKRAYISTKTAIPLPSVNDRITWQGVVYQITPTVIDLAPSGESVLYEVIIRK